MINTLKHLAYTLKVEIVEFEKILDNIDNYYYKKEEEKYDKKGNLIYDKNGLPVLRVMYPSIGRLKEIQSRILKNILLKIEFPEYAYGAIKGRDNIKNAKKHQGKKFNFTTDLKSFFPSINHKMVFDMFRSLNFSPTVSRVLTKLTTYKGELPQGTQHHRQLQILFLERPGIK